MRLARFSIYFFLLIFWTLTYTSSTLAAPRSTPYLPGETSAPACSPQDPYCTVTPLATAGINANISQITGLTTPLSIGQGGTGLSILPLGGLLYGINSSTLGSLTLDPTLLVRSSSLGINLASTTINDLGGILDVAHGGTGTTTTAAILSTILPDQVGHTGKFLTTNGSGGLSWALFPFSSSSVITTSLAWGSLAGTLTDQTDLVTVLATKEPLLTTSSATTYLRGDKTWNTLTKAVVGLDNVENTALSSWVGSPTLTTIGTITTGTWNGSIISPLYGGTGTTSLSGLLAGILPSQTGANGKFLMTDGASTTWATLPSLAASTTWGLITGTITNQTDLVTALAGKESLLSTSSTAAYLRGDKSWNVLDKTAVGLGNVENTGLSSWAGSNNISMIGTITSGTWNGTIIPVIYGGTGTSTLNGLRTSIAAAASGVNSDITSLAGLTTALTVGQGGTGSTTTAAARLNLGAAASGSNNDITSLGGLTTPLSVAQGGSGTSTIFTAGSILFAGSGGTFRQDNSRLYWDATNGYLGIGTSAPSSSLHITGSISLPVATVSSNTTLNASNYIILVDASSANITISLPDPASVRGRTYIIKVIAVGTLKTVTLDPLVGQIEGAASLVLSLLNTSRQIISNGSSWYVIN